MTSSSSPSKNLQWQEDEAFAPIPFEKVIGLNDLLSIAWLSQGLTLAATVARVVLPNETGTGTCFLVGPDLVLTTHHVFPDAELASKATIEFNYQTNGAGVLQPVRRYTTDSSQFRTNV